MHEFFDGVLSGIVYPLTTNKQHKGRFQRSDLRPPVDMIEKVLKYAPQVFTYLHC